MVKGKRPQLHGHELLGANRPMSLAAFQASHSSKNGDVFVAIARRIAGEDPPQWFVKHLRALSASVMLDGNVHARQFGKAEARARLRKLSESIEFVGQEILDPLVIESLLADNFGPLPDNVSPDRLLREIARRADVVSSRLDLLGTGLDEKFERLSDALRLIVREAWDRELSQFLKAVELVGHPGPRTELGAALDEIRRRADAAFSSPYLTDKAGGTKAGRSRALLPMASTPRAFCAAIILEAWAYFHNGEYPIASNHPQLWEIAEEYWQACGGEFKSSWRGGELMVWRRYFKEAAGEPLVATRIDIRRNMIESSSRSY